LRFIDHRNDRRLIDRAKEQAWMPVDLYVGGAEHAVLHLLYSRFWHHVLFDRGHVTHPEPFRKLVNQGMILGEARYHLTEEDFRKHESALRERGIEGTRLDEDGKVTVALLKNRNDGSTLAGNLSDDDVEKRQGQVWLAGTDIPLRSRADKMSKSRGNVVNPDEVVRDYGADSLRLYEMFMGPLEATKPWSMSGVGGVRSFLDRGWRMIVDTRSEVMRLAPEVVGDPANDEQRRVLHRTIKAVTEDIQSLSFNTAIARMMEFVNYFGRLERRPKSCLTQFVQLLSPFAPHIAEELWSALGNTKTISYEAWPTWDPAALVEATIEIPVQVNGKVRAKITVLSDADQTALLTLAKNHDRVRELLEGKSLLKEIVVPGKLVNLVVR
jgi:leucyl-tRNA synthetase